MTWICPVCSKEFRNNNQWHSCARLSLDDHLRNKPEKIKQTVYKLIDEIQKFGDIELNPVKSIIQVRAGATFLSIKPKKDLIELEFQLSFEVNEFPIVKCVRISSNRVLHLMYIDTINDIDKQLIGWIHDSYILVTSSQKK
jgi:Domain of unknown function (DUF5655)